MNEVGESNAREMREDRHKNRTKNGKKIFLPF
jgi:hypothetical protein